MMQYLSKDKMKALKESDVLRIMREEWNKKVSLLKEEKNELDLKAKVKKGVEKIVISPELKVMHSKSGIRYTIDSVSPKQIILRTPEGESFNIPAETLEDEYEVA